MIKRTTYDHFVPSDSHSSENQYRQLTPSIVIDAIQRIFHEYYVFVYLLIQIYAR